MKKQNGTFEVEREIEKIYVNDKGEHLFEWMARQNLKKKFKKS